VTVANKGASRSVEGGRVARARTIIEPSGRRAQDAIRAGKVVELRGFEPLTF
jgi:hypothetical protein